MSQKLFWDQHQRGWACPNCGYFGGELDGAYSSRECPVCTQNELLQQQVELMRQQADAMRGPASSGPSFVSRLFGRRSKEEDEDADDEDLDEPHHPAGPSDDEVLAPFVQVLSTLNTWVDAGDKLSTGAMDQLPAMENAMRQLQGSLHLVPANVRETARTCVELMFKQVGILRQRTEAARMAEEAHAARAEEARAAEAARAAEELRRQQQDQEERSRKWSDVGDIHYFHLPPREPFAMGDDARRVLTTLTMLFQRLHGDIDLATQIPRIERPVLACLQWISRTLVPHLEARTAYEGTRLLFSRCNAIAAELRWNADLVGQHDKFLGRLMVEQADVVNQGVKAADSRLFL